MLRQICDKIKSEYGTEKVKSEALIGSIFFVIFGAMLEFMVQGVEIELLAWIGRYLQVFLGVGAISIAIGVCFYKKKKKNRKLVQILLSILVVISLVILLIVFIPIVLFFRMKEFLEIISKFKLSEIKIQTAMISLVVTSFIGGILFFVYLSLMPYYLHELEVNYIIALSILVSLIITYTYANRIIYFIMTKTTKITNSKRRIIKAYYQDYKEKNIILLIIMLGITIYLFAQKDINQVITAFINSITTIVLFDTIKDKWKSKLYKKEEEFELIQSIYFDINIISNQVHNAYYINRSCSVKISSLKDKDFIKFREYVYKKSNDKRFRKIIEDYNVLTKEFIPLEEFNKKIYELECKIIKFKIKHE